MFNKDRMAGIDVDTIRAFFDSDNPLYKKSTQEIVPNLSLITEALIRNNIRIVAPCDHHFGDKEHNLAEKELKINGGFFDLHAEHGTIGAQKISATKLYDIVFPLLNRDVVIIPNDANNTRLAEQLDEVIMDARQIIVQKQSIDVFYRDDNPGGNVYFEHILDMLCIEDVFVYGVYAEYCIYTAVLGLLNSKRNVWVITDAIVPYDRDDGVAALKCMEQMGARFITTAEFRNILKHNFEII